MSIAANDEGVGRRRLLLAGVLATAVAPWASSAQAGAGVPAAPCEAGPDWPQWQAFRQHFIQPDGRVLDASTVWRHSSSEGQSYALFFALVANDAETFAKVWRWAVDNLMGGNAAARLPAWLWGLDDQGQWRVIDDNSASDAELWFVYALLEAARLWQRTDYHRDALALLAQIEQQEVADIPGLGPMLLPGFRDFVRPGQVWQLNPSYLPLPVLRRLAAERGKKGPWPAIARNTGRMIREAGGPHGFAADWVAYTAADGRAGRFITDPVKGDLGSYDAIRTYLWAGLTSPDDPLHGALLQGLRGMSAHVRRTGLPPERVQVETGVTSNTGPFGFSAALVPYFWARAERDLMLGQQARARQLWQESLAPEAVSKGQPPYYDHVLNLFSSGWQAGHYAFQASGRLRLGWETRCG